MPCNYAMKNKVEQLFLTSKEAKKELKLQDCDLAHIRLAGKLKYIKSGNSYLYCRDSVEQLKKRKSKIIASSGN
jgi:hypothetical protein